jgi:L-threonylcarbamoyladenylate synthase
VITTDLSLAKSALHAGEIIAIPTETVYGLAGNAFSEQSVKKIFDLKKRPFYNPVIVHIKSPEVLTKVAAEIPPAAAKLAEAFWPGPLTLVLKKQPHISNLVTAGKPTVAVRMPNHPLTLRLLDQLDFPLAAPSANPFGSISPTTAAHVANYFKEKLGVVLDGGPCQRGIESTIVGFEDGKPILYRLGSVSVEELELVVGPLKQRTKDDAAPDAPGMLSRHYAPNTATCLTDDIEGLIAKNLDKKIGVLVFTRPVINDAVLHLEVLSANGDDREAARNLYAAMHRLDQQNLDLIIAERFPEEGLGKSINDRLSRAIQK